jgi:hypothetical protein
LHKKLIAHAAGAEDVRVNVKKRIAIKTCVTTLATICGVGVTQVESTMQPTISKVKARPFPVM